MSRRIKVGVFGGRRGQSMISVLAQHPDAELTAICDKSEPVLEQAGKTASDAGAKATLYKDFEGFFQHDMDAVVLTNYATEHTPFAVRLLDSGRHICSEVLACQNMAEAVELVEAVERSKKVYTFAENYSYFTGTLEMRRIYRSGELGEYLHGEGEYVHDCESIWPAISYGEKNHWRCWSSSTFYCTHSMGPLLTITGLRPTRVTAYEVPNVNSRRYGRRGSDGSVIVCQMSNGGTAKILPWCGYKREPGSVWYSIYGTKGMVETDRWGDLYNKINIYTEESGEHRSYKAEFPFETELSKRIGGHGGSDFYTMHHFLDAILDRPGKELAIDVYQALDMTLPGTLGYRSICEGNIPLEVPDMRDKAVREKYRNDRWCTDPKLAGPGQPEPSYLSGKVDIPDSVYGEVRQKYLESLEK